MSGPSFLRGTGAAVRSTAASAANATRSIGQFGVPGGARAVAESDLARRELVFLVGTVVAMGRLVDGTAVWLIALLAAAVAGIGARRVVALRAVGPVPPEAVLVPAVAAGAATAALHLVPVSLGLIVAVILAGGLVDLALALEARIAGRPMGFTPLDRTLLLGLSLLVAFVGFSGVAALVPDAFVEPAVAGGAGRVAPPLASLLALAIADGTIAALLGYRFAALRAPLPEMALRTAATYAAAIVIGAGLFSAAALPRLLGPALLTLVFFLWESLVGAEAPTRRDPRFIWQVVLLAIVGVVVVVWNLAIIR